MVLTQQTKKLMLLAKTDRSVMGKQLVSLLSFDPASEKGHVAIRKNAFALVRLQKYKYAIATFLFAQPPMLKEACAIASKQMNDPLLGLLIARIVEHQHGPALRPSGLVLGTASRRVVENMLPVIPTWNRIC